MEDRLQKIKKDINERIKNQPDSRCATEDEVSICWLICEIEELKKKIKGDKRVENKMVKTLEELINDLAIEGGAIVSSNDCLEIEIANAMNTGRMCILEDGLGFIRRTKTWLDLQKARKGK